MKVFAGFKYELREVPVDLIDNSPSQPASRNDEDAKKRVLLRLDIEENGQKDPVDLIAKADGRYELVEGHGRVDSLRILGIETANARVYPNVSEEDRPRLREKIFGANATSWGMTTTQWTEYAIREQRLGNEVKLPTKVRDYVDFLHDNFSRSERERLVLKEGVGPNYLGSARQCARAILGLGTRGKFPETVEATAELLKDFNWVDKHSMQRAVIEHFASGGGMDTVRRAINSDSPLKISKRKAAQQTSNYVVARKAG